MKKKITIIAIISTMFIYVACKESKNDHHSNHKMTNMANQHKQMQMMTKVVKLHTIQVAFDLMSMEQHMKMMKTMKTDMKHHENMNHAVSLTILDIETKKPIKGANVDVTMSHANGKPITTKAQVMASEGMYHYVANFKMDKKENCTFTANIQIAGKNYKADATFNMTGMSHDGETGKKKHGNDNEHAH